MAAPSQDDVPESPEAMSRKKHGQFVAFRLGDQSYAFRIAQIEAIVILEQVTKIPQSPEYVEGVSNLRGSIIPIINLRRLFGLEPKAVDAETRTIVVNVGSRTIGCTVDTVSQVVRIEEDSIQPAPDTVTKDGAQYIGGFARINGSLLILIEIDELLAPEKLERISQLAQFGATFRKP